MLSMTESPREVWKTIDLKERGQFEIQLKKPTWDELSADSARLPGYLDRRFQNVIGWRGVESGGEPMPFSPDNFRRLCEQIPAVFHFAAGHLSDLYYSFDEDSEKNSDAASSDT